ncbi:hypothetical protein [Roseateles sp.]|uniref:hypothetical protein n=1 Tax=Roseateles sp. TaxID=1971397 RepID=UPI0032632D05
MNRLLPKPPTPNPTTFVYRPPPWLMLGFRCAMLVVGAVTAVMLALHWQAMPLWAALLAGLLTPALMGGSAWPRLWRDTTRFIADETGMFFPAYPALTFAATEPRQEAWLAVPWQHVANIRVATEVGEDGSCVAFDLQVSPSERARFFGTVGEPRDRRGQRSAQVFAAYGGWPPSAKPAAARLLSLQSRSGA